MKVQEPTKGGKPKERALGGWADGGGANDFLIKALGGLLKPESLKAIRVIHASEGVVSGFLLTTCPMEAQDHWKDFEVHLQGRGGAIVYAVVDGKRFGPTLKRTTGPR